MSPTCVQYDAAMAHVPFLHSPEQQLPATPESPLALQGLPAVSQVQARPSCAHNGWQALFTHFLAQQSPSLTHTALSATHMPPHLPDRQVSVQHSVGSVQLSPVFLHALAMQTWVPGS